MKKLSLITIGQTPRRDIMSDVGPKLRDIFEIIELGALDGLGEREIFERFCVREGEDFIVTRLFSGAAVKLCKAAAECLVSQKIRQAEELGSDVILIFCTGELEGLRSGTRLLTASQLLKRAVPALCEGKRALIVIPDEKQLAPMRARWQAVGVDADFYFLPPGGSSGIDEVCARAGGADLVLLDCVGYDFKLKRELERRLGRPVLLARELICDAVRDFK